MIVQQGIVVTISTKFRQNNDCSKSIEGFTITLVTFLWLCTYFPFTIQLMFTKISLTIGV